MAGFCPLRWQRCLACHNVGRNKQVGVHNSLITSPHPSSCKLPSISLLALARPLLCSTRPKFLQVTVSTVGLVDVLERFAASSNVQLALSLHATTDEVRDWIVPVNRRHNLAALTAVLRQHYGTGNAAGRRVLVEYTMLAGVNDSLQDAQRLVALLEGVDAKVGGCSCSVFGLCIMLFLLTTDNCMLSDRSPAVCQQRCRGHAILCA